jgi:hypothetical protein
MSAFSFFQSYSLLPVYLKVGLQLIQVELYFARSIE